MGSFIKLFDTCTGKYFYDVGKNQIVKVDELEYKHLFLYKGLDTNEYHEQFENNPTVINNIKKYTDKGFLSSKKPDKIIHPYTYIVEDILSKKLHIAILQITQMCNLKCSYCPYSGNGYLDRKHINKSMSIAIAKKSIDFLIANGKFSNEYNIGFYGGEPLIKFSLIQEIVAYAKEKSEGKNVSFFITTNGTFLTREIISFLSENNFSITVSLDGPKMIHDKNRKIATSGEGSFEKIYDALKLISTDYPDLVNKIGINAVWDMEESYNYITEYFISDPILSQYEYSISPVDNAIIDMSFSMVHDNFHEQQLSQMLSMMNNLNMINIKDNTHDKSSLKFIDDFEKSLTPRMEMPEECHYGGMCLPGYNRLFINKDGALLPCEKVSANSNVAKIGDIYSGFDYDSIKKIMNVGALTVSECKECWCGQFCTCCFKFVDDLHSMSREKKLHECKLIKQSVMKTMKEYVIYKETQKMLGQS